MKTRIQQLRHGLGVPEHSVSWREHLAAILTSGLGIALVAFVSLTWQSSFAGSMWLVASMGATAVLVFALPHGPLSQPWAVIMGHVVSALVGVLSVKLWGGGVLAASLAVALAIAVMHLLRCIHPPGGATALSAVMLATEHAAPGWSYVFSPVLMNAVLIVLCAMLLNAPFAWRRYPLALSPAPVRAQISHGRQAEAPFSSDQLRRAFAVLDGVADISDEDAQRLYQALRAERAQEHLLVTQLITGAYYSNGRSGPQWAIACLKSLPANPSLKPVLTIEVVAGEGAGRREQMSVNDFLAWAKYRVVPDQEAWHRFDD